MAQWSELFDTDFICHTKQMVQVNKLQHVQTCRLLQSLRRTDRRVWSSNHCCGHAQRFEGWHAQTTTWKTQRNSMSVRLSQLQATMRSQTCLCRLQFSGKMADLALLRVGINVDIQRTDGTVTWCLKNESHSQVSLDWNFKLKTWRTCQMLSRLLSTFFPHSGRDCSFL